MPRILLYVCPRPAVHVLVYMCPHTVPSDYCTCVLILVYICVLILVYICVLILVYICVLILVYICVLILDTPAFLGLGLIH